jgi:hypothetical protein
MRGLHYSRPVRSICENSPAYNFFLSLAALCRGKSNFRFKKLSEFEIKVLKKSVN